MSDYRRDIIELAIYNKKKDELYHSFDDELYHYGRKGMKWGENIFEDNPITNGLNDAKRKLKAEMVLRRAKKAGEQQDRNMGLNGQFERRNADIRREVNMAPNREIYSGETARGDERVYRMTRNDGAHGNKDTYTRDVDKYSNTPVPPSEIERDKDMLRSEISDHRKKEEYYKEKDPDGDHYEDIYDQNPTDLNRGKRTTVHTYPGSEDSGKKKKKTNVWISRLFHTALDDLYYDD